MGHHTRRQARARRQLRVRRKISGTAGRPRLNVFRSVAGGSGQVLDGRGGGRGKKRPSGQRWGGLGRRGGPAQGGGGGWSATGAPPVPGGACAPWPKRP